MHLLFIGNKYMPVDFIVLKRLSLLFAKIFLSENNPLQMNEWITLFLNGLN